jgi:hypothetical protein
MSAPAAKGLLRSGEDDAAHLFVRIGLRRAPAQFAEKLGVEGVQRVRAVERIVATWSSSSTMIVL